MTDGRASTRTDRDASDPEAVVESVGAERLLAATDTETVRASLDSETAVGD